MVKFSDMPYERADLEAAGRELKALAKALCDAKSGEEQFEIHQKYYALKSRTETMVTLAQIRHDIDVTDEFYDQEQEYYDREIPVYENYVNQYKKTLYATPFRSFMEGKIGKVAFKNMELEIKGFDESIIGLRQEELALCTKYMKLIASAKIEFGGETLNISLLRKYLISRDRMERKAAWEKLSAYFQSVTGEIDEIYDALVKNRTAQARAMGYETFTELGYIRMMRNSYDRQMVENFREQVKKYFVPFAEKLHEQRRIRLGVDKLHYYDNEVYFKEGNPAPVKDPQGILKAGQEMYGELSSKTKEFFDFMMENELFDVFGRKTKRAGGYMTFLPEYKAPFIFANFNGTSGDVDVITHECGHAFQGYVSRNEPILEHNDIGMETAEIHSMSMEYFTEGWMEKFFGSRSGDYLKMHLEDGAAFVPYGCMVDEFQHIVYDHPELTPAQRKSQWRRLEKIYKPHLDYCGDPFFEAGGFWQKQHHIFDLPFYYIDYCLASVCAMQYKVWMDEDFSAAWESYMKLCRLSASDFYTNMLQSAGLESPFEDGCIHKIVEALEDKVLAD